MTEALAEQAADPGRLFSDDLCWNGGNGCAGDVRLYDWQKNGYGLVQKVLFTARDGATLSGRVWATRSGPKKRPGHRHHRRLGSGRRTDVLVRRPGARQGRLHRSHVRPAGPGAERHARPVPRRTGGRAGAERRASVLRRHRGCDRLPAVLRQASLRAGAELRNRHEPRCEAGRTRGRRARRRLRPLLQAAEHQADRPGRALLRRRRRLLHRAVGPAREGRRRLGQPRRPGARRGLGAEPAGRLAALLEHDRREGMPGRSGRSHRRADHQARARHVRGLRPAAAAEHGPAGTSGEVDVVAAATAKPESTAARSSSAAARTSTSASSPTRHSAPRCAAPTRSTGTRRPGSTSTSSTRPRPTSGC